jgi:hypothetical protein
MPRVAIPIAALSLLIGCTVDVPGASETPDAVSLRGAEIVIADEGVLHEHSIGLERFACDGEWTGQGRLRSIGTYRIQGSEVCVTVQNDVTTNVCRAFHFERAGELYLFNPQMNAWLEYEAYSRSDCP